MAGALVQARSVEGNGSAPTLAFLSNATAANLIVAGGSVFQNSVSAPTHTGDTFTRIGTGSLNGNSRFEAYYAKNIVGGATTITFHFGSTTDYGISIEEWSGLDTTAPLDANNAATGTSTAPDGGSVAATAGGVVWGGMTHGGSSAIAIGEGTNFSLGTEQESVTNMPIHTENRGAGGGLTAGSYTTPHTLASSQAWAAISAAFKAAAGGGGTANTISLTGTLTLSGAVTKQARKPLSGALTLAGAVTRQTGKALAGGLSLAGALAKRCGKPLAGGLTLGGSFTKQCGKALSGGLTLSGASIVKAVAKPLTGALTLGGALAKRTSKAFAGGLTLSGSFSALRVILIAFAGTLSLSGALTKRTGKALSGAIALSGGLTKACAKGLTGSLAMSGSLAKLTAKGFAGTLALSGGLTKRVAKAFAGALSLAGSLASLFTAGAGGGGGASPWYYRLTQWQWRRRR